jgi:hypothetical protein
LLVACTAADSRASDGRAVPSGPTTRRAPTDDRDLRRDRVYIGVTPREPGRQDGPIVYVPFGDCGPCDFYPDDEETYCDAGPYFRCYGGFGIYSHRAGYGLACRPAHAFGFAPRRFAGRSFTPPAGRAHGSHMTTARHR